MHPEEPSCGMKVNVYLPSGDGCSIELSPATPLKLKASAQQHFQRRLKLAKGRQLDLTATASEAELRDGDAVTAVVQLAKVAAARTAFAWHVHGVEVVT